MKNKVNILIVTVVLMYLVLGCSGTAGSSTGNTAAADPNVKPIAVEAKVLTKEYDTNELAADGKYKGKLLAVTGKIGNIAETFGNVTVSLDGHNAVISAMCSFEESEKAAVAKLKKGQTTTLIGTGDGSTAGLYAGLTKCKVQ